jgi:protein SCO1/2
MRQAMVSVIAALACVVTTSTVLESADFAGRELIPPLPGTDFTLKATNGPDFRLSQLRGKVVLISFGYTFCPDICPTTLVELSQVRARLGDAAKRVQVAFITLDPERDTLERLRIYKFHRADRQRRATGAGAEDVWSDGRETSGFGDRSVVSHRPFSLYLCH